ncbi:MAG: alpha-galactosidase [Alistipes sp.]|nr:alpha-galactosidase [Alistipes sp.]
MTTIRSAAAALSVLLCCAEVSAALRTPNAAESATASYAHIEGDSILVLGNDFIERRFEWNGGNLKTLSLADKRTGAMHSVERPVADFVFTRNASKKGEDGKLTVEHTAPTDITPACLRAKVEYKLDGLEIRREFRIYDAAPAIACDNFLRLSGNDPATLLAADARHGEDNAADRKNIEAKADMAVKSTAAILDRLNLEGAHWHARAVEFSDVTDWNDNLVWERDIISYRKNSYRGNLLFVRDGADGNGFFFLKEAPCSAVQLAYGKGDFTADFGSFAITGIGISADDLSYEWVRAYSSVAGVFGEGELAALTALRLYQKQIRAPRDGRDEMVMMNTWGDRSQDTKVNERFCLEELERAARLGITHFQIDDGWQEGKSPNSAVARGSFKNIWSNPDYWKPARDKYPNGLAPIMARAKESGIEVGLWFNPSVQNDFEDWRKDAEVLLGLHREYGIRVFKIDGLTIPTKKAETNLRRLFDTVVEQSGGSVMFNLDATASRRGGYHMFNEYGNIFLENRYTDWQNYYPYRTLRNLWQLSRYVPAERIQTEFLNPWRNADKYGDDPFAPSRYGFDYLFATTMAGQPLAWLELANLPDEAYDTAPLIKAYEDVAAEFHSGIILPVGEEPSGRSWTGFQSILSDTEGYLLLYREATRSDDGVIETFLPEGAKVYMRRIAGYGKETERQTAGRKGALRVNLKRDNTFVLYKYTLKR